MAKNKKTEVLDRDNPKFWREQIRIANIKAEPQERKILKYRDYWNGFQHPLNSEGDSMLDNDTIVNMVYTNISTILPSIIFRNPRLYVSARKKPVEGKDTVAAALTLESLLNYYYEELKIKREITRCLMDSLLGPWGIMEVGYTLSTEKIKGGKELIVDELIKEDSVFVKRVSPLFFRADPVAIDHQLNDASWIAFKWVRELEDVQNDPSLKNTKDLKSNTVIDMDFKDTKRFRRSKDSKRSLEPNRDEEGVAGVWNRVEGWDIWDKKTKRIRTIVFSSSKQEKFLRDSPWPNTMKDIEGFPVELIYFNENPDEQFPLPDIQTYINEQDELNQISSLQLEHIKKLAERKFLMREGALEMSEQLKLTKGGSGTISETSMDPKDAIFPVQTPGVSQDLYVLRRQLMNDILRVSSVQETDRGGRSNFGTATEAALAAQGSTLLREGRQSVVENFTVRIMKKVGQVLQQTLDKRDFRLNRDAGIELSAQIPEKLTKIEGRDAANLLFWLSAGKEDIQGEFDFTMEVGSMRPVNKETRKQDMLQLLQILAQSGNLPDEVYSRIFEAFEIRDAEKLISSIRELQQQQQQAAEKQQLLALQAQQAERQQKSQVDLTKTQMKTDTAKNVQSQKNIGALGVAMATLNKGGGR